MKRVRTDDFLRDYERAVKELQDVTANRDSAISQEIYKAEQVVNANGYSQRVKEVLIEQIVAEKEAEYDIDKAQNNVNGFERYLEDVVEDCDTESFSNHMEI